MDNGAVMKFAIGKSANLPEILADLKSKGCLPNKTHMIATGGGAYKYGST
eukprot:UN30483